MYNLLNIVIKSYIKYRL